jgi:hypothetical protein
LQAQTAELERDSLTGVPPIPAMTTDAERECYYRLAKEAAGKGAIVELGAWLGASTAYIAAGIRDSGVRTKAHVYDQFQSKPGHVAKVKAFYDRQGVENVPVGPTFEQFQKNLGPLLDYVTPHQGRIEKISWCRAPIALLVSDAPKRVPAISAVLTEFREALTPGSVMAWQDFCHFPSYEIPACLYRLRDHLEFVEAIVPGTTLVFRVKSKWDWREVSEDALSLSRWDSSEITKAWLYWFDVVPQEKFGLFDCGAAMFLCDLGLHQDAVIWLDTVYRHHAGAIIPKWRYLKANRADFVIRYQPLFDYLEAQGALC